MNRTTEEEKRSVSDAKNSFYQQYLSKKSNILKGKVWAVNGSIFAKDGSNSIPTITIQESSKGITITKNGEILTESTFEVTENDRILIEIKEIIIPSRCTVITDEEQLTAFIEVEPGYQIIREMKDFPPTHKAVLTINEQKVINVKVTIEEIKAQLRETGITYGIDEEAIILASQSNEHALIEVARGIPAEEGKDGFLELQVEPSIKHVLTADQNGNIDFRETRKIPTIEPGDTLAVIYPPKVGKIGRSIKNQELQPRTVNAVHVHSEKGTKVEENKIIATKLGRPYIQQNNHVVKAAVVPKYLQRENVNIATGNIRFYGDVEVEGEVEENTTVEAGNDIVLHASVNSSVIAATHSIYCSGNISNSILSAGEKSAVLLKLGKAIGVIAIQLDMLISVIDQITLSSNYINSKQKQSIRSIVDFLMNKRFVELKTAVKNYIFSADQYKELLPIEWRVLAKELQELFFTHTYLEATVHQLQSVLSAIQEIQEKNILDFEENSSIVVASTLTSTLKCNGDVHIVGHGSLNTIIEAQGKVIINGLLRGGSVFAKEGVEIREAGSSSGVKSSISVPDDQTIRIDRAYEGTELKIGPARLILNELGYNISACLNPDGHIVLK
ncbi:DUF342 domain-containing protein [Desemzia sp. RIT804]|uniref:FapA family protein n=1 Tax=Desemzia sp. RIT 804 TaxID=2810209 RepID=UPI001951E1DB|nr:FapA family protein [Desemzia sp. RIT 804]MBM6615770.1 DUF342 domain-containing protein [Desemzia sp. RIT 804]